MQFFTIIKYKYYILQICSERLSIDTTGLELYHRPESQGIQVYEDVSSQQTEFDAVGRPVMHQSALKQATGEAVYCDDMPHLSGKAK